MIVDSKFKTQIKIKKEAARAGTEPARCAARVLIFFLPRWQFPPRNPSNKSPHPTDHLGNPSSSGAFFIPQRLQYLKCEFSSGHIFVTNNSVLGLRRWHPHITSKGVVMNARHDHHPSVPHTPLLSQVSPLLTRADLALIAPFLGQTIT